MKIKLSYLAASLIACLSITACDATGSGKSVNEESTTIEKVGYSLGFMMAKENKKSVKDLDVATFQKGFQDGYEKEEGALTEEQMQEVLKTYQKEREEKMAVEAEELAAKNKIASDKFLAENQGKKGVKVTKSGLQYKVIKEGKGGSPKATDIVEVNYEGKLIDGKVFDSSYERGEPVKFPLNEVIKGWTEGVQLMQKGATYEFVIPADLAYGKAGNPNIEPNSTLIFKVELLNFTPADKK